jgi:RNA polymerase sigma factor (sigma-70 family)
MNTKSCTDVDLASALEILMMSHGGKWLRFVQSVVQNRADAEDVLQEAALKMLLRARQFGTLEQARMYLGRVICNTAIERYHLRRRQRRRDGPLQEQYLRVPDLPEPPLEILADNLDAEATVFFLLNEGLAHLPVKQYEALRMTIMEPESVSIRDAGAEHGIPYSTLRHRKVQGLRRLRRFIRRALRSAPRKLVLA